MSDDLRSALLDAWIGLCGFWFWLVIWAMLTDLGWWTIIMRLLVTGMCLVIIKLIGAIEHE